MKTIKTDCCPILPMVLRRHGSARTGLHVRRTYSLRGDDSREFLTVEFRKAKRGESDYGGENAKTAFAICTHCPFCGSKVEEAS
jgi:hypothetical protein